MHISYIYKYICPNVYIIYINQKQIYTSTYKHLLKLLIPFSCLPGMQSFHPGPCVSQSTASPGRVRCFGEASTKGCNKTTWRNLNIPMNIYMYIIYYIYNNNQQKSNQQYLTFIGIFLQHFIIQNPTGVYSYHPPKHPPNPIYSLADQ